MWLDKGRNEAARPNVQYTPRMNAVICYDIWTASAVCLRLRHSRHAACMGDRTLERGSKDGGDDTAPTTAHSLSICRVHGTPHEQ